MASDIVEVIESYVPLKKAGQNYKGNCPFHNEKTPSFTVSPQKQIFHCFGCSESGGVISFLMKHEHMSYPEAVKTLAERYNIEIEEKQYTPEQEAAKNKAESFVGILRMASEWFRNQLLNSDRGKAIGLSYIGERGIRPEMVERFGMGYCPEDGRAFADYAIGKGYSKEFLDELGLVKENQRGVYDIYRGRLIFPITDLGGKIIAFGARALKKGQQPKYINSPEHLVYNKSRTLYALHEARKSISQKDNVYVVEGYTDVIAMHQAGIENTVATCGTSVTEDHISRLRHMTKNVTLLFDGDVAGQKAALRTIKIILKTGLNARVVSLPEGEDPDSLSKTLSPFDFQNFLEEKQEDFLGYLIETQLKPAENDPVKKAAASKIIIEAIAEIKDNVMRAFYIQETAAKLRITEQAIAKEISKLKLKNTYQNKNERSLIEPEIIAPNKEGEQIESVDISDSEGQERDIIRMLLFYGNSLYSYEGLNENDELVSAECSFAEYIISEIDLNGIQFQNDQLQQIFDLIKSQFLTHNAVNASLLTQIEDQDLVKHISTILSHDIHVSENWTGKYNIQVTKEDKKPVPLMEGALNKLKIKTVFKTRKKLMEELSSSTDENHQELILKKINKLDKVKAELSDYFGISIY